MLREHSQRDGAKGLLGIEEGEVGSEYHKQIWSQTWRKSHCSKQVDFMPHCNSYNCTQAPFFHCRLDFKEGNEWRNALLSVYVGATDLREPVYQTGSPEVCWLSGWVQCNAVKLGVGQGPWTFRPVHGSRELLQPIRVRQEAGADRQIGHQSHVPVCSLTPRALHCGPSGNQKAMVPPTCYQKKKKRSHHHTPFHFLSLWYSTWLQITGARRKEVACAVTSASTLKWNIANGWKKGDFWGSVRLTAFFCRHTEHMP